MRKLLLFVLLIVGCAREYECDVGTIDDDGEFYSIAGPGTNTQLQASTTLDWPMGKRKLRNGVKQPITILIAQEHTFTVYVKKKIRFAGLSWSLAW